MAQSAPVADAFRANTKKVAKRLILSAEEMPEAKYGYQPTRAQMTFGEVVAHRAEDNYIICSTIAGTKAPEPATTLAATDTKAHLIAWLKETFTYCDQVLAPLDDTKLGESLAFAGLTESRVDHDPIRRPLLRSLQPSRHLPSTQRSVTPNREGPVDLNHPLPATSDQDRLCHASSCRERGSSGSATTR